MPSASAPPAPTPARAQQRLLAAWVAEQTQRLDPAERAALTAAVPDWRAQAAQLIAEGLLAYVVLEMVAPDLAIAQATGSQMDGTEAHAHAHTDDAQLTERLTAHLQDFIDYRDELTEHGGLHPSGPDEHGQQHRH